MVTSTKFEAPLGTSLKSLIRGFVLTKQTEGKSPRTVEYYHDNLKRFLWYAEKQSWPDDIRLHKEKQAEINGFLNWLEAHLGINIEDLKSKTRIKEYYQPEVGWQGFLGALEQNRKTIQLARGIDVTRREPQETIRAEFDASVAKLKPILETIELTDKLIDQIVYKLYSLTEAEIAVVEGRS
jgi:hypothetical protein